MDNNTKGTILVVDDTRANVRLLAGLLDEQGYNIQFAFNGNMALTSVQRLLPDLILLDIKMPDMDGFEVCKRLKEDPYSSNVPIIFISALDEVLDKVKAFSVGAVDYITKPFQFQEVLVRVETHLKLRNLQRDVEEKNAELGQANQQLSKTLADLKATQDELLQSEKMAVLGQLVAGVAHEINSPLGAIRASISNITNALDYSLQQLPRLLTLLSPEERADFMWLIETITCNKERLSSRETRKLRRVLKKTLEEYNIDQSHLLAERLVEMGVYEDITPYLRLLKHPESMFIVQTAYNLYIQKNNGRNIMIAVKKASKVVFALRSYARYDVSAEMSKANIIEGLDIVLVIYHNQIKRGIEVVTNYEDIPPVLCYPDELNQVWTNIIHNAIQAMQGKGRLEIAIRRLEAMPIDPASTEIDLPTSTNPCIVVTIADNGPGIPLEIQDNIFKPFFTTKPTGEGSGLGLDIVQKIINRHNGKIEVNSQPGRTAFSIYLPVKYETKLVKNK
ncbi:response regulator [Anaerolineales bacterium HSG24]|nr:response regulator [Anaerolineales bacterium HSG24]